MKQQADLSGLDAIADRDERLRRRTNGSSTRPTRPRPALREQLRTGAPALPRRTTWSTVSRWTAGRSCGTWLAGRADVDRVLLSPQLRPLPRAAPRCCRHATRPRRVHSGTSRDRRGPGLGQLGVHRRGHRRSAPPTPASTAPIRRCAATSGAATTRGTTRGTAPDPDRPQWPRHAHHGHRAWARRHRRGARRAVDRLRRTSTATSATRPHYLDCLQFMLAPFPHGGDPLRDGDPERGAARADQLVGLPRSWRAATATRCGRRSRADRGRHLLRRRGRQQRPRCGSIERSAGAVPGHVHRRARSTATAQLADFSSRGPTPGGGQAGRRGARRTACCRRCPAAGTASSTARRWPRRTWPGWWR